MKYKQCNKASIARLTNLSFVNTRKSLRLVLIKSSTPNSN